jgi:glucosamine--fructose-6-phosphate aminotransferase (isomerizing)
MSLESEIAEQPAALERLLDAAWPEARALGRRIARARHLTFVARGSSDNAATYGKYLFESRARIVAASAAPSLVTRYRAAPRFAGGAVIGISQSGSSPDVAAVVARARHDDAFTIAITNAARSKLARSADETFLLRCGPERAVAATKTYTTSCLALAMLASATAEARHERGLSFTGVIDAVREAIAHEADARRVARRLASRRMLVVLGRGYDYAAALEGALKVKELARVWAEPYSTADFAHGPRTLLERGTAVVLFASRGVMANDAAAATRGLQERGARVYAITNDVRVAERADDAVLLSTRVGEALAPIALAVAAQHLARAVALRRGHDPERPAGLSKVTRTT